MPDVLPAIDPTCPDIAVNEYEAMVATVPLPVVPDPEPGDPDTEWTLPVPAYGRRVQVHLLDAVTHENLGELTTATVADGWDHDYSLLTVTRCDVTVSLWDPLWVEVASAETTGTDGRPLYRWSPKIWGIAIGVDGDTEWVGIFRQPIDYEGDEMVLAAVSYNHLFYEDTLGSIEQTDLYEGKGNFEAYAVGTTPPGVTCDPGTTALIVADAARGTKSLEVTGSGWAHLWKIPLAGAASHQRTAEGSSFGKWPTSVEDGSSVVITYTRLAGSGDLTNAAHSLASAGRRPSIGAAWSTDPVSSGARLSASTSSHYTWVALRGSAEGSRYDVARLQQGILTGFLSPADGARYPELLLRVAKSETLGGFPYGITSRVKSLVGSDEFDMVWNHNGLHTVADCLSACMERVGGAEARITPQFVLVIRGRLGAVRNDVRLHPGNLVGWKWNEDPGAQADVFAALTGRGTGTSLVTSTIEQPRVANRHRITKIVRAPNDMTLNQADAWTIPRAEVAARQQIVAWATLRWEDARDIAIGDTIQAAMEAGNHGLWDGSGGLWVRVMNMHWLPDDGLCDLTLGVSDGGT